MPAAVAAREAQQTTLWESITQSCTNVHTAQRLIASHAHALKILQQLLLETPQLASPPKPNPPGLALAPPKEKAGAELAAEAPLPALPNPKDGADEAPPACSEAHEHKQTPAWNQHRVGCVGMLQAKST